MKERIFKFWTDLLETKISFNFLLQAFILIMVASILTTLSSVVSLTIGFNEKYPEVYNWVKLAYYIGKRPQMFFFMLSIPTIFLFIIGYKIFLADRLNKVSTKVNVILEFIFLGAPLIALSYIFSSKIALSSFFNRSLLMFMIQIIILVSLPLFFYCFYSQGKSLLRKVYHFLNTPIGFYCNMISLFLILCFIYFPIATNNLPYVNEYLNIPSTLSNPTFGTTNSIDTINSIPQAGLFIRTMTSPSSTILRPTLPVLEENRNIAEAFSLENSNLYYYDFFLNVLVATDSIPRSDIVSLQKISGASNEVLSHFIERTIDREKLKSIALKNSKRTIVEELRFNLHWQILSRWYFHHHNFLWGPVLKFASGIDLNSVFFQYGLMGGAIQYGLSKYLLGGFNVPNYFLIWSILFGIYFFIFHFGIFSITKSKNLTLISAILFVSCLMTQQYEYIFLGPGLNPIRHLLDTTAFVLAYKFFKSKSIVSFLGFVALILLNFLLNPEFGFFCSAALFFTVVVYLWVNNFLDRNIIILVFASFVAHLGLWLFLKTGQEVAIGLYLGGYFSPVYNKKILFVFLFLISTAVTLLFVRPKPLKSIKPEGFILLAAILYTSAIFVYPLFGMSWNHIVNISPIIIFTVIIGVNYILNLYPNLTKPILGGSLIVSSFLFLYSAKFFIGTKGAYQAELNKYKNERWQLHGNQLLTQIPEMPIRESIRLIERHSAKNNQIALISRFDNILPVLTEKATLLPGHELMGFLFSKNEYQKVISFILEKKPKILFTDRDILLSSVDELIDSNTQILGYLHQESKMRLERVNRLKTLFSEVKANYRKIDEGGLLTVWERI